jgi:hypothetical protein
LGADVVYHLDDNRDGASELAGRLSKNSIENYYLVFYLCHRLKHAFPGHKHVVARGRKSAVSDVEATRQH